MTKASRTSITSADPIQDVADRLLNGSLAMMDILTISLGAQLGYYRLLMESGALTPTQLAGASGTAERYAREWLEQQAVTGLLGVEGPALAPSDRAYRMLPGVAEVLADSSRLSYLQPLARQLAAAACQLPALVSAYRTGGGVPWTEFGTEMRESEGALNRPGYEALLVDHWLAALPDIDRILRAEQSARIADVGCGAGWSAIALATGYPNVRVDGYDIDSASVASARLHAAAAGVADRVQFHCCDIAEVAEDRSFDLVTAFECLHDLPYPVAALQAMRRMVAVGGAVLVADMKVADQFTAPGDDVERLMYGFSVLICLPDSMSSPGSAATGTVMRSATLRRWAAEAGFEHVTTVPIDHDLWRFYRLDPAR